MSSSALKVAFLGLGNMGHAMASNILKKGFPLTVWNRTTSKANDLVDVGAVTAASPREAVAKADIIVSCLFDDKSCLEIAREEHGYLAGIQKGAIHINTTTITPGIANQLEELHQQHGAYYISGPVLGRPEVAVKGQLRSFLGGNQNAIERARSVIEAYSSGSILVVSNSPAQASVIKLTANMILGVNISLFGQAYALNERWGIDRDITHQLLCMFYSHPGLLAYEGRIQNRNYERAAGEGFGVEGGLKDVNAMITSGDQVGVPLPLCNVIKDQFVSAIGLGLKDLDWSTLGDMPRIHAGLPLPNQQK